MTKLNIAWCYVLYGRNISIYYQAMQQNIQLARNENIKILLATIEEDAEYIENFFRHDMDVLTVYVFKESYYFKYPKFLRYILPLYFDYDYYFYKDTDSIVSEREMTYSNSWVLEEDAECVIFRDHPLHVAPILGGMFGLSSMLAVKLANKLQYLFLAKEININDRYLYDQLWLAKNLYPQIINVASVYSSFFYYSGEKLISTTALWEPLNHIGSQHMIKEDILLVEHKKLCDFYSEGRLTLPFIKCFAPVYQKAKVVIYLAVILRISRTALGIKK